MMIIFVNRDTITPTLYGNTIRLNEYNHYAMQYKISVYISYVVLSCIFTTAMNVVHSIFFLQISLTSISFLVPSIAGILFGITLAHNKVLSQQLTRIAYTDSLTLTYNRLHFDKFLESEISKIKRYGGTFSIIFFDLDHFKQVNDNYGHDIGDKVLRCVTDIVSSANRSADIFARYGGEEFIILTPSTDLAGASNHAERLRKDIADYDFPISNTITCSFGVAEFDPDSDNSETVIKRADNALYLAKENGRNRVEAISSCEPA